MGKLARHGDEVRDERGSVVALWFKRAWYEYAPLKRELVTASPEACAMYARATPPEAVVEPAVDVRWKIALLDRLGVIRSIKRVR